ncbi:hypothetical protein H4J63_19995, partial [Pseudoalteromonas sp. 5Ae-yellow]
PFTPEELQGDDLDGEAPGIASSQAEQDLANALMTDADLDGLEDDFDDELLIDNDFSELETEIEDESLDDELRQKINDEVDSV